MKDHEVAQLVNGLREIAAEYGQTQQVRERIAAYVVPAFYAALAKEREAGKLEAAQTILKLWHDPWGVTKMPFIDRLKLYVEELK